jgi:hypothetical protein
VDKLGKIQAGKMLPGINWNEFSDLVFVRTGPPCSRFMGDTATPRCGIAAPALPQRLYAR